MVSALADIDIAPSVEETYRYEYIANSRIKTVHKFLHVIDQKQVYKYCDSYGPKKNYVCIEPNCNARVCIVNGMCVNTKRSSPHTHPPVENKRDELEVNQNMKEDFMQPASYAQKGKVIFDKHCAK